MSRLQLILLTAFLLMPSAAPADPIDAAALFENIYGTEAKRVAATRDQADDAAFAAKLLTAAAEVPDSPPLQHLLYEKALSFGLAGPAGIETAERALEKLRDALPERQAEWDKANLDLLEARYRNADRDYRLHAATNYGLALMAAGDRSLLQNDIDIAVNHYRQAMRLAAVSDEIPREQLAQRLRRCADRRETMLRVEALTRRVTAGDAEATMVSQLLALLIGDLNDTRGALLLAEHLPEATRTHVEWLASPLDQMDRATLNSEAEWLQDLSRQTSDAGRATILQLAAARYHELTDREAVDDMVLLGARLQLQKIDAELQKLPQPIQPMTVAADNGPRLPDGHSPGFIAEVFDRGFQKRAAAFVLPTPRIRFNREHPLLTGGDRARFGLRLTGYIHLPAEDSYTLQISGGRWCSTRAWLGELPLLNADAPQDPEHVAEPPWVPTLETRPMKLPAGPVPIRLEFRKRLATNLSVRYRRGDGPWQPLTFEQISHKQDVKSRVQPPERPANVEPGVKVVVHSLVVNEEAGGREMKPIGSIVLPTFEADWSKQPPLPNARRYHTEWSGWLRIDRSGFYRFELAGNGHALMYIDGVAVTSSGVGVVGVPLQQGYRHVAVHFAPGRSASLTLKWQPPAAEQTQPIPAEQLSHAPTGTD